MVNFNRLPPLQEDVHFYEVEAPRLMREALAELAADTEKNITIDIVHGASSMLVVFDRIIKQRQSER